MCQHIPTLYKFENNIGHYQNAFPRASREKIM
jgi:hypothetical protein